MTVSTTKLRGNRIVGLPCVRVILGTICNIAMHTKYTNLNARGTIGEIAELPDDVERDESQPCGLS